MSPFIAQQLVGLGGRLRPPYNLVISNVPGPLERQYLAGAELEAMYPFAVLSHGTRLFISFLTISGKMGIGFVGDRDSLPRLQRLALYSGAAFEELDTALAGPPARVRGTTRPTRLRLLHDERSSRPATAKR